MLKTIELAKTKHSETNPAGRLKGKEFDELVASVKEKGVLVPVLVRSGSVKGSWEVVAGNRRLAAARAAGLEEIPAHVVEMTDEEAQEAQIVENLQRQDIHPLEESEAYLKLVKTMADVKAVAVKVGKTENYIHGRVMLANLADDVKKAYRDGVINDGHAAEIAKLSPGGDQQKAVAQVKDRTSWGETYTVKELQRWIKEELFDALAFQPWLKNKEAMVAVGACQECPPATSTLFGEVKEGTCTTTKCHERKMEKYLKWVKEKTPDIVLVSTEYGREKGVLNPYDYEKVAKTTKGSQPALILHGKDRGKIIQVKVNKSKPVAHMSAEEKKEHEEKQKKEKEAEAKRQAAEMLKRSKKMDECLENITWPLKEKNLDPLFELIMDRDDADLDEIIKRRKIEADCNEDGDVKNPDEVIRKFFAQQDPLLKMQIIVELLLLGLWDDGRIRIMKKFN